MESRPATLATSRDNESISLHSSEAALILTLTMARIEHALGEGSLSIDNLTQNFSHLVSKIQSIETSASTISEQDAQQTITHDCQSANAIIADIIVAFQFFDRMNQRLTHVVNGLQEFSNLVTDQEQQTKTAAWQALLSRLQAVHTLDSDKGFGDAIVAGKRVDEAMQDLSQQPKAGDDIEFF